MIISVSRDRHFQENIKKVFKGETILAVESYEALAMGYKEKQEDVVLVDAVNIKPFDLTRLKCNVLVLTGVPKFNEAVKLMRYGIRGYGNRFMLPENMMQAVESVASGQVWMPPFIISKIISNLPESEEEPEDRADISELSDREIEVAENVAKGFTNREIAEEMEITVRTVKAHMTSIFNKTGLRDRVALALRFK